MILLCIFFLMKALNYNTVILIFLFLIYKNSTSLQNINIRFLIKSLDLALFNFFD